MDALRKMRVALLILLAAVIVFTATAFPAMKSAVERQLGFVPAATNPPPLDSAPAAPTLSGYVPVATLTVIKGAFDYQPRLEGWRTVFFESFAGESYLFSVGPDQNSSGKVGNGTLSLAALSSDKPGFAITNAGQSVDNSLDMKLALDHPSAISEFGFVCRYISDQEYVFVGLSPAGSVRAGYVDNGKATEVPMMLANQQTLSADLKGQNGNSFRFTCQDKLVNIQINNAVSVSFILPDAIQNKAGYAGWFVAGTEQSAIIVSPARMKIPLGLATK